MKENKVSEQDISELKKAIEIDKKGIKKPNEFGLQVSGWIGKMISKAVSGSWNIAMQVAPALITNALNAYYGF